MAVRGVACREAGSAAAVAARRVALPAAAVPPAALTSEQGCLALGTADFSNERRIKIVLVSSHGLRPCCGTAGI